MEINPKIEPSWKAALESEFSAAYMQELKVFLIEEKLKGCVIFPPGKDIFNAFNLTPFDKVKVVILGQDPYHGKGQAHGLSFSVPEGITPPPSLVNIFKELSADLGVPIPKSGNLEGWAKQGVLLLNAILTVRADQAASHHGQGWEKFTNAVIKTISDKREHVVFILWGNFAREKKTLVDASKHLVIESSHPSPFSASNGFFGSKPFSKTNEYLKQWGVPEITWSK